MASEPKKPESKSQELTAEAPVDALAEKLRLLDEREAALAKRETELTAREENARDSSAQRPVRPSEVPIKGDAAYKFKVGPPKPIDGLNEETVECCDETEAIRWYVLTHQDPKNPGKQVDPMKYSIQATCVDPRRANRVRFDRQLAQIRMKAERGATLSEDEQLLLDEADRKVYGIS